MVNIVHQDETRVIPFLVFKQEGGSSEQKPRKINFFFLLLL